MSWTALPPRACLIVAFASAAGILSSTQGASSEEFPEPVLRLPPSRRAPVIDGRASPGEYEDAALLTGLVQNRDGVLTQRDARVYVTWHGTRIYVAMVSELPPWKELFTHQYRRDRQVVRDDSVEMWVRPSFAAPNTCQLIVNEIGSIYDIKHMPDIGQDILPWKADWKYASSGDNHNWLAELAFERGDLEIPADTPTTFGLTVCRNWKRPWVFSCFLKNGYGPSRMMHAMARTPLLGLDRRWAAGRAPAPAPVALRRHERHHRIWHPL